jgi:hypothetical protein
MKKVYSNGRLAVWVPSTLLGWISVAWGVTAIIESLHSGFDAGFHSYVIGMLTAILDQVCQIRDDGDR